MNDDINSSYNNHSAIRTGLGGINPPPNVLGNNNQHLNHSINSLNINNVRQPSHGPNHIPNNIQGQSSGMNHFLGNIPEPRIQSSHQLRDDVDDLPSYKPITSTQYLDNPPYNSNKPYLMNH